VGKDAFEALDRGDRDAALDALLNALEGARFSADAEGGNETREHLRRAIVGILSEAAPDDPTAREYRRRLATALY
jgi:putative thioredoxin